MRSLRITKLICRNLRKFLKIPCGIRTCIFNFTSGKKNYMRSANHNTVKLRYTDTARARKIIGKSKHRYIKTYTDITVT